MYPGLKVTMNGREVIIPAISLGLLRAGLREKMQAHDELLLAEKPDSYKILDARADIILAAIRRNYPSPAELSDEEVLAFLDMANTTQVWLAVIGASGFMPGEAEAGAEKPRVEALNGTSSPSIPPSPEHTDGLPPSSMN